MERAKRLKKIPAVFYQSGAGPEPVREWLKALDAEDRKIIGEDLATVEYSWPVGMRHVGPQGKVSGKCEVSLRNNRIARVIFGIVRNRMVLLHGFIKKTQKMPDKDVSLARKRLKDIEK